MYLVKLLFYVGGELRVRGNFPHCPYLWSENIVDSACNSKSTTDICEELWWLTLGFRFHGASGNVAWPVSPKSALVIPQLSEGLKSLVPGHLRAWKQMLTYLGQHTLCNSKIHSVVGCLAFSRGAESAQEPHIREKRVVYIHLWRLRRPRVCVDKPWFCRVLYGCTCPM